MAPTFDTLDRRTNPNSHQNSRPETAGLKAEAAGMAARRARAESFMVAIPVAQQGKEWISTSTRWGWPRESSLLLRDARTLHHVPRTSLDGWSKSLDAMANRQNVVGDGRLAKGFGRFPEGARTQVNTLHYFDHCPF